jgi:hypothetical protein
MKYRTTLLNLTVGADIIENCIFVLWRHLEYYLGNCIPADQQTSMYQVNVRHPQQMRRLQGQLFVFISFIK